ncbi:MAG: hypothetical protein LQ346_006692 [Caloplaca aetnensis]|nr:MAG: hypothetical protein LQ346_006692 [Caloplaca aetnensis]
MRVANNAELGDRPTESLKGFATTYNDPSFLASANRDDLSPDLDRKKSPPASATPAPLGKTDEDVVDKHSTKPKEEDGSNETVRIANSTAAISSATMQPPARPGPRLRPKASNSMAPPAVNHSNGNALRVPPTLASSLRPPPSAASTLRGPPNRSLGSSASLAPTASTLPSSKRSSKKVLLEPGHSPLDWANLVTKPPSTTYLRGDDVPPNLLRVPPSMLRYHNGRKGKNAWGVWQGKVYNLTPYMKFHPGGVDELMKGAGREKDGERLFLEIHPWVNWEGLLGECLIGILVSEEESKPAQDEAGGLEEMD